MITKQQKRRMYRLHYNLRKRGNKVDGRGRTVVKRAKVVSEIEHKWLSELIDFCYCVRDDMFAPSILEN